MNLTARFRGRLMASQIAAGGKADMFCRVGY